MNWLSKGIVCHKELFVTRNWLSHAMVVPRDGCSKRCLSQGIGSRKKKGSRKELLVARNCWSQGTGGRKEGIGGRKEEIGGRKELVVARNW